MRSSSLNWGFPKIDCYTFPNIDCNTTVKKIKSDAVKKNLHLLGGFPYDVASNYNFANTYDISGTYSVASSYNVATCSETVWIF